MPYQADLMAAITQDAATATFSPCRRYRYVLTRTWDPTKPYLVILMLNPSTADELQNDPTVERCQRRARRLGYGGVIVLNLFALRSTDPNALYAAEDPIGPDNDAAIERVCRDASLVVCAWGTHGSHLARGPSVRDRLLTLGIPLFALGINADGSPKHPLYLRNDAPLVPYPGP